MKYRLLLLVLLIASLTINAHAATLNVPQQYSTIQAAINAASSGDKILVKPGTYKGALTINKGVTLEAEQYYANNPKSNPTVIDGNGADAVISIPSGVTGTPKIIGFQIKNAANDGIAPFSPFVVEYCYFTNAKDLIDYERGSGGITRNNIFENAGDDALDLDNQIDNLLIENNQLLNSNQDGIEIRLQSDSMSKDITITIKNNLIQGSGDDGIQFIDYASDPSRKRLFIVQRNLFVNNREAGIGMMDKEDTSEDLRAASVKETVYVFNNVFKGSKIGISGGDSVVAVNNIFVGNGNDFKNVDGSSKIAHNIWQGSQTGSSNFGAGNIQGNPNLDSSYKPQSGSPAIDAGVASYSWNGQNVLNIQNFNGNAPDIGVFEAEGSAPPPTCTESNWQHSDGPCQPSNTLIRTWTKTGNCQNGIQHPSTETKSCNYSNGGTYLLGDVTKDGKVDLFDLMLIARAFGKNPGEPGYNPNANANGQGGIDLADLILVAKDYGKTGYGGGGTPTCTESNWQHSDGPCQPTNTLTRTWTKTGNCQGGVQHPTTETTSCTYGGGTPPTADCGDGVCLGPVTETCSTCQADCGPCQLCNGPIGSHCPECLPSQFDSNSATIDNPWFPLPNGLVHTLQNGYKVRFSVLPGTETINGVKTRIIEEREWSGGSLVEVSFNWFAQTRDGTVCYMGEDVCHREATYPANCQASGSWEAGKNGAAGIMMPPVPTVGQKWYIEDASGQGAYEDAIVSRVEEFTTPYKYFPETIYIVEDFGGSKKRYAKNVGMIFDDGIKLTQCQNNIACG